MAASSVYGGGIAGVTQAWRLWSKSDSVGGGNAGSANAPTKTVTNPGTDAVFANTVEPQSAQK